MEEAYKVKAIHDSEETTLGTWYRVEWEGRNPLTLEPWLHTWAQKRQLDCPDGKAAIKLYRAKAASPAYEPPAKGWCKNPGPNEKWVEAKGDVQCDHCCTWWGNDRGKQTHMRSCDRRPRQKGTNSLSAQKIRTTRRMKITTDMGSVKCEDVDLEWVSQFVYLGNNMEAGAEAKGPVQYRLALASNTFKKLMTIWKDKKLDVKLKLRLYKSAVCSVMRYGSDSYTVGSKQKSRINGWNSKRLATFTGRDIQEEARSPTFDLVGAIVKQRAQWLGHVLRLDDDVTVKKTLTEIYTKGHMYEGSLLDTLPPHTSLTHLTNLARDRRGWNEFVKTIPTRDSSAPQRGTRRSSRKGVKVIPIVINVNKLID
jgi:hypothetical protein